MKEEVATGKWRVTWGLELYPDFVGSIFDAPDVDIFKLTFETKQEASHFIAEMQRFLGGLYLHSTTIDERRLSDLIKRIVQEMATIKLDSKRLG